VYLTHTGSGALPAAAQHQRRVGGGLIGQRAGAVKGLARIRPAWTGPSQSRERIRAIGDTTGQKAPTQSLSNLKGVGRGERGA